MPGKEFAQDGGVQTRRVIRRIGLLPPLALG